MADEDSANPLVNEHSTSPWVWVHLGLTVVTAGLWLPVWLFLWLRDAAFKTVGIAIGAALMGTYHLAKRPVTGLVRFVHARLPSGGTPR